MRGSGAESIDGDAIVEIVGRERVGSALRQTLAACAELVGASNATLLSLDLALSASIVCSSAGPPGIDIEAAAMLAALAREPALIFPQPGPAWVDAGADQTGATVFAMVARAGPATRIVALSFDIAPAIARARVDRLMSAVVALVSAQWDSVTAIAALEEQNAIRALALDHGSCGVIAVSDDHSVLFANAAATTMLADGDGLQVKRGMVRPVDYKQAVRFEAALDAVQDRRGVKRTGKQPALVMLVPSDRNPRPLIVALVPVGAGSAAAGEATALIYLLQGVESARGLDTIAALHGLSGVERRLLTQLCAGRTVAESAAHLRIKLETARAYLKQIFVKTGTHRQTELVALMTRYLRVMRGEFDFQPA